MVLGTNAAKAQNHRQEPQETITLPSPPPSAAGREAEAGERTKLTSSEDAP